MKQLRIIILSWEIYPVYCGGLGILVRNLVNELERQGHIIEVLIPDTKVDIEDPKVINLSKEIDVISKNFTSIPNFKFLLTKFAKKPNKNLSKQTTDIYKNETPTIIQYYARAVEQYITKQINNGIEYDIVIGMDWVTIPTFVLLRDNIPKLNFAFYINGTEVDRNFSSRLKGGSKAIAHIEAKYYKQAKTVFTISSTSKNNLINYQKVPAKKIKLIYNDSEFQEKTTEVVVKKDKQILFLGRLVNQKGIKYLLESFRLVLKKDPEVKLMIVGSGELKAKIVRYIRKYKLSNSIKLLGWIEGSQKEEIYSASKLFVIPSVSEPFGLTALESIRSGTPVIASNRCGFCDIVPPTPIFSCLDTKMQSNLIIDLLNNKPRWQKLITKQKKELAHHSWSQQIVNLIEGIIETKKM